VRGAKDAWITIVEWLEDEDLQPLPALRYLISLLINRSNRFYALAERCLEQVDIFLGKSANFTRIFTLLRNFVEHSDYSARAFEVVIHAAYQALDEMGQVEPLHLKPLSQMRSANKKHGNIGDIELLEPGKGVAIAESWDTKYGKENLREELEELFEKLSFHPECKTAGFITNKKSSQKPEIATRTSEIEEFYDCKIVILSFEEWYKTITKSFSNTQRHVFLEKWLRAVAESFCQKRRDIAPIDEPCEYWIQSLFALLE